MAWIDSYPYETYPGTSDKNPESVMEGTMHLIAIIIAVSALTAAASAVPGWHVTMVDDSGTVGGFTSLALDSGGYPHISYYREYNSVDETGGDLMYAEFLPGYGWFTQPVDTTSNVGWHTSLALDESNRPWITYDDRTHGDVKYAHWTGSSWSIGWVAHSADWEESSSLEIYDGIPYVSYYNWTGPTLMFARWNEALGEWIHYVVDRGNGGTFNSLAFSDSGITGISYYDQDSGDLRFARSLGGGYSCSTVDSTGDVGKYTSLAFATGYQPRISYHNVTGDDLKYAYYIPAGGWGKDTVESSGNVGTDTSLALDNNDNPQIAYYYGSNGNLKWAEKIGGEVGGTWYITTVDTDGGEGDVPGEADVGMYASIAVDSNQNTHISYHDHTHGNLLYAEHTRATGVGVFRNTTHRFYIDDSLNGAWDGTDAGRDVSDRQYDFGLAGDIPVSGDWLGNCVVSSIGVFRPSTHTFYLDYKRNGRWDGAVSDRQYNFGLTEDYPVAGDWNGIGRDCIGVFRPSTRTFYLDWNGNGRWDGGVTDRAFNFGLTGDYPVAGDWNGIKRACIGVFRPSTHTFYLDWNGNGRWDGSVIDRAYNFGLTGDIPVAGVWDGFGSTNIGVFRPSTHKFYIDYSGNGRWDGGVTDRAYNFGLNGDQPLSGMWN